MAIRPSDDNLVLGGARFNTTEIWDFALVRIKPEDGDPDPSFNGDGDGDGKIFHSFFATGRETIEAVAIGMVGNSLVERIVVSGPVFPSGPSATGA
jgi:hypothetical protein